MSLTGIIVDAGHTILEIGVKIVSEPANIPTFCRILMVACRLRHDLGPSFEVGSPVVTLFRLSKRDEGFIFHVKIYQLTVDRRNATDPGEFLRTLSGQGWKIVFLRRENEIKHSLSNMIAVKRGEYFKYDDEKEDLKIAIEDCDEFAEGLEERRRQCDRELPALEGLDYCEVIYERD